MYVGVQQLDDAAILAQRAADEELGLALESLQEAFVVSGVAIGIDDDLADAAQIQPLRGESIDEGIGRSRVGEHPAHFPFQDGGAGKLPAFG